MKSAELKTLFEEAKSESSKKNRYIVRNNLLFFQKEDKCGTKHKGLVVPKRMKRCQELVILNMEDAKQKQKLWYDRRTVKRQFQPGELGLVIAPSRPNKLSVQCLGPGEVVQQLSETNYVVKFP
ncbi:integrase catalytic domain-containing protein [Trichonephila clavipes]|nr:integrase catalytic domain-containing protein [Trichonephila clavipes]